MKKKIKTIPEKISQRTFTVIDPIFRQRIFVLLNQDQNSYIKFLNKNDIVDTEKKDFSLDRLRGMSTWIDNKDTGLRDYLILLKEFDWTLSEQNTLIHEIVHTIIKIWDSNNIPHNTDTQEFFAHSIGNLYEQIGRKLLVLKSKK